MQGLQRNLQQAQTARYMVAFSLSASFTSSVLASGNIWLTITIPNFDSQLMGIVEAVHASQIRLSPLVSPAMKTTFELYALEKNRRRCF